MPLLSESQLNLPLLNLSLQSQVNCLITNVLVLLTIDHLSADSLYFMLRGIIYQPGSTVIITDIGTQAGTDPDQPGGTLVCVTTNINTQCCRGSDGGNGGDWYFPDGSMVPRGTGSGNFGRTGSTHQIRLNRLSNVMHPVGAYECRVPASNGVEQVAVANIQLSKSYTFIYTYYTNIREREREYQTYSSIGLAYYRKCVWKVTCLEFQLLWQVLWFLATTPPTRSHV